jgi:hypothetical protein
MTVPEYEVTLIEKLFVIGTITVEANSPEEAEQLAGDEVLENDDAASWNEPERVSLSAERAEEQA